MKIIIDDKIPYIKEAAKLIADNIVYVPGSQFTPEIVKDADALIIRTRTHCTRDLLSGSKVKFIATATIGFDHIDTEYCKTAGITWKNAPGCNSSSVAQYIQSALLIWQRSREKKLNMLTIGIVGVGNVGRKIAQVAQGFGMHVLLSDPPRAQKESSFLSTSLEEMAEKCDIITFHVPLYRGGEFNTYHLADAAFFSLLRKRPLIMNSSRGEVIDTDALNAAINKGVVSDVIIDVWENEPNINRELLKHALIGTPHIAGYSADGKANATRMSLDSVCRFFHLNPVYTVTPPAPAMPIVHCKCREDALLQIYNPMEDCERLKSHPESFEALRGNYPLRREEGDDLQIMLDEQ